MLRGLRHDLWPMAGKELARGDEQDLGSVFHEARKSRIDVVDIAGIEDFDFLPGYDGRAQRVCDHRFDYASVVIRVDEHRNAVGPWKKVSQQSERF